MPTTSARTCGSAPWDWEHASEWRAAPAEVWEVDGEKAGTVQAAEPLTYVKLDSAGHLVRFGPNPKINPSPSPNSRPNPTH